MAQIQQNITKMGEKAINILWLIGLVLFTPITGMFVNYDVFSWRSIVILSTWTIILLTPYVITGIRGLYMGAAVLIFIDGLVNLSHWLILKCAINASSIFVFLNTNWDEAIEFMTIKKEPILFLLIPYVAIFITSLIKIPRLTLQKRSIYIWAFLWLFCIVFITENIANGRFVRLAIPDAEKAMISFVKESTEFRNLKTRDLFNVETNMNTTDSTLVVVIIGESCNRNHMSLYGYERKTSPHLSSRDDIMVFDNVISANSNTLRSVMNFLTENNMERARPIDSCLHIFDILHSSPYKSYWISNQSPIGLWDNGVTNLAKNADVVTYVNLTANSSMENTMIASYDERIFKPFHTAIADTQKNKVVFLHLMGNHTNYAKRYPASYAQFSSENRNSDKRTRVIDSYDNSILYNDFIVDSFLSILNKYSSEHPSIKTSAIYFSDHGENVFDEGDWAGHDYSNKIPHSNVEIPFILWFSPSNFLGNTYKDINKSTRLHTPYMIDDIFHTIIDLTYIRTPCFDSTRSIINPHFNVSRPRLLEDGYIYEN